MDKATVVVCRKNGGLYVANVETCRISYYEDDYAYLTNSLHGQGLRKLVIDGNFEFWGK